MNRRRFLKNAAGLLIPAAPALILPKASAQLAGGLMFPGPGMPAGVASTPFTFDPATAPATATFANSNRNFTGSSVIDWHPCKTSQSYSAGKEYLEFKAISVSAGIETGIGFADAAFPSTVAGNYLGSSGNSVMFYFGNLSPFPAGYFTVANPCTISSVSLNDIFQLAADFGAGKGWIGQNNTWMTSGGDPATGTNPWLTWTASSTLFFCGLQHDTSKAVVLSLLSSTSFSPPSGFTAANA